MDDSSNENKSANLPQPNFVSNSPKAVSKTDLESGLDSQITPTVPQQEESCCQIFAIFLSVLGMLAVVFGLMAAVISYYVFGIKFLISDYQTSKDCGSDIGNFVLISLVMTLVLGSSQAKANKGNEQGPRFIANIIICLFWLGWGIYGFRITVDEDCQDLDKTNLLTFSNVISIYFISMGSFIIFVCILIIFRGLICN